MAEVASAGAVAAADFAVDLTDNGLYRDGFPHGLFAELRAQGPVLRHPEVPMHRAEEPFGFWVVLGHPELQEASRSWEDFAAIDGPRIVPTHPSHRGRSLTSADPDAHTRLRKLISAGFTPRMIGRLEEQIGERTTRILDDAAAAGTCDLVRDIAYLLPMHLIADIVGMPEADRAWVFTQTDRLMRAADPAAGISDAERAGIERELFGYATALGEEKRRHPADDVWSVLAGAEVDDGDGGRTSLVGLELDLFFLILSIAGSETTRNVISHGVLSLLEHPDQLERLRGSETVPDTAVDELIRWVSPVTCFGRTVVRDVALGGRQLSAGDRITLWFPSANRDERAFVDPFRFDLDRTPNRHVAFGGGGVHYCLGAHLARREIRAMVGELVRRFEVEPLGDPVWLATGPDASVGVSIDRLPVRLHAR